MEPLDPLAGAFILGALGYAWGWARRVYNEAKHSRDTQDPNQPEPPIQAPYTPKCAWCGGLLWATYVEIEGVGCLHCDCAARWRYGGLRVDHSVFPPRVWRVQRDSGQNAVTRTVIYSSDETE